MLDRIPALPTWPAVPAARSWLVGCHLGLTTSVGPRVVGVLGRWSNARLQRGRGECRTLDSGQPRDAEKCQKGARPFNFKTLSRQLPTSTTPRARQVGHFDILTVNSSMDRYLPIILAQCHHFPDASTPPAAHLSPVCSNRDRRRHPALNSIHLHAAVRQAASMRCPRPGSSPG